MIFAAIDIGSNAVRLQVTRVIEYQGVITFKKLEFIRFPLRLGFDVFSTGKISAQRIEDFFRLMNAYKIMMDLYKIDHYYGCATSAMREAENGQELILRTKNELDLEIDIISGQKEADMINRVISVHLEDKPYLHIDVGGGSTELNLYYHQKKIKSESFRIGGVRNMNSSDDQGPWIELKNWINQNVTPQGEAITAIGTGGNIKKMFELVQDTKDRSANLDQLVEVQDFLKRLSLEERMMQLQLNPDRADVIIPASEIYIRIMKLANTQNILVPDVGLKDGINNYLFETFYPSKGKPVIRN